VQSIRQATERLRQAASKIAEALNRAASQAANDLRGQAKPSGDGSDASDDNVVDAEFEEVDPRGRKAS
jgi:molecular chaperone DnaK